MQEKHLSSHFPRLNFRFLSSTFLVCRPSLQTSPPAVLLLQVALSPFSNGWHRWTKSALSRFSLPLLVAHFFPVLWCGPSTGRSPFGHVSAPLWSTSYCSGLVVPPCSSSLCDPHRPSLCVPSPQCFLPFLKYVSPR